MADELRPVRNSQFQPPQRNGRISALTISMIGKANASARVRRIGPVVLHEAEDDVAPGPPLEVHSMPANRWSMEDAASLAHYVIGYIPSRSGLQGERFPPD